MKRSIILFALLIKSQIGVCQDHNNALLNKFIFADSVVLVSHMSLNGIDRTIVLSSAENESYLVKRDSINASLIKQRHSLKNISDVKFLWFTLTRENHDSIIEEISCFDPHHTVLIFKERMISFIDICFECRHFVTSKDITLSDQLSKETWEILERFFRKKGMTFQLKRK
jgi:hypothetical protein